MSKPTGKLAFAYQTIAKMEEKIETLTAERDALQKDADRYKWIAENADVDCRGHVPDGDYESLDDRIDAALQGEQP